VLEMDPRASHVLSKCYATELHPQHLEPSCYRWGIPQFCLPILLLKHTDHDWFMSQFDGRVSRLILKMLKSRTPKATWFKLPWKRLTQHFKHISCSQRGSSQLHTWTTLIFGDTTIRICLSPLARMLKYPWKSLGPIPQVLDREQLHLNYQVNWVT
jgi:hypothetical protein